MTKGEEKPKGDIHIGGRNFNFGQIGGQAAGHVMGNQRWGQQTPEGTHTHHSQFSSSFTAAYNDVPPPSPYHPPPAYPPYGGGYGYPPPYHHPLGLDPRIQDEVVAAFKTAAAVEEGEKPPLPKTEGELTVKPVAVAVAAADPPPAAAATCQQTPRKEPAPAPAPADGYPGWDAGYHSPPQYGYPPRHGGGYHDGGGYPVQGYPTHHGHGHGHGGGYGNGYYGYGAPPPQHMGMGRIAAGAAAVHEAYHRYRQHGRQGGGYRHSGYDGHYQGGGYGHSGYGHHGKFKQGHHGKYSHYYGPHHG